MSRGRLALIGVGNPDAGDDGVGPWVVGRCREAIRDPRVVVRASPCQPGDLPDALQGFDAAIVVDACTGPEAGEVVVMDGADFAQWRQSSTSTHGFDLGLALNLAQALGVAPPVVTVVAVGGREFDPGSPMSATVQAGAVRAVDQILAEVGAWLAG